MLRIHLVTFGGFAWAFSGRDGPQGFSSDGGPATSAELSSLGGVTVDGAGNLLIADGGNNRVREVAG